MLVLSLPITSGFLELVGASVILRNQVLVCQVAYIHLGNYIFCECTELPNTYLFYIDFEASMDDLQAQNAPTGVCNVLHKARNL